MSNSVALSIVSLALVVGLSGCVNQQQSISASPVATAQSENAVQQSFHQLLDDIWEYELTQFPSMARSQGKPAIELSRQFTDSSLPAMAARNAQFEIFKTQLDEVDTQALSHSEKITLMMQQYRLDNYISQFNFKEYRVPITSEYGFHSSIGRSLAGMRIQSADDLNVYKQMLSEVPELFANNITYMREGLANGHTQPQVVLTGYEDTITAYVANLENADSVKSHPFYAPIKQAPESLMQSQDAEAVTELVKNANDAFSTFYDFFTTEYVPGAKADIAASNWPDGNAFYNNRIKHFTTTDMTAQEIHDVGLAEVARIRSEMQSIVDSLSEKGEFKGDINEFINFLRTDERFYAKTPEELIMYASYVAKQMDAKLPQLFYKMPRTPYGVAPVPDAIAPKYTTGRYVSPRSDDQPGYYWVNTYALDKRPLYAIPALTLHEAVPGHHFQISLAAEMDDLPNVRRSTYISAFGEGWGLYSEYLGLEVGIYDDPYDNFGRLSYEMWRACRLVVDTGMHVFGWSRQQALDYMLENTALSEHNVTTEIDRYISWPAQALAYKLGEIQIKALREKAETELGDNFDLRAFHDQILANGSIPLVVLEEIMLDYIKNEKAKL